MNTERWDYKNYQDSFQLIEQDAAGWTLFWGFLIVMLLTDFGRAL